MNTPQRSHPLWETLALIGSFIFLWIWFLARQAALKTPGGRLSPLWFLLLGACLLTQVIIMVRRTRRLRNALHGESDVPIVAPRFPSSNGHTRK